jgi:hypothetical protein
MIFRHIFKSFIHIHNIPQLSILYQPNFVRVALRLDRHIRGFLHIPSHSFTFLHNFHSILVLNRKKSPFLASKNALWHCDDWKEITTVTTRRAESPLVEGECLFSVEDLLCSRQLERLKARDKRLREVRFHGKNMDKIWKNQRIRIQSINMTLFACSKPKKGFSPTNLGTLEYSAPGVWGFVRSSPSTVGCSVHLIQGTRLMGKDCDLYVWIYFRGGPFPNKPQCLYRIGILPSRVNGLQ